MVCRNDANIIKLGVDLKETDKHAAVCLRNISERNVRKQFHPHAV